MGDDRVLIRQIAQLESKLERLRHQAKTGESMPEPCTEILLKVNPEMARLIGEAVKSGLYGNTLEDAAERLIALGLTVMDWED